MTRDLWQRLKQIFSDALEREPAEREAYIREAAQNDPELLSELLKMLAEIEHDSGFLSRPALSGPHLQEVGPQFNPDTVLARRFRVIRFIARGGMGEVYEAEDLELNEHVALKTIRPNVAEESELMKLFKSEVQLARRVTHPNVCRIFDLAQHEEVSGATPTMLLSMELLTGQTLSERLRESGPLSFRDALPLIEQIAAGLQAMHEAGVIHGDLKPGNVFLATRGTDNKPHAVVMDFGMALPVSLDSAGQRGSRGGTPDYYAPEQLAGNPASTATDVFSFALVISDMLGVPRAVRLKPDAQRMPPPWARALRKCLHSEPQRRYGRPAELASSLRRSADPGRRSALIAASAALVGAIVIPSAVFLSRPKEAPGTSSLQILVESDKFTVRAPSPDGRFVAATSWDTGDLILREVHSEKVIRLTHKTTTWAAQFGGAYAAVFSPDGRFLAYQWLNSRTDGELRVIGADGSGERTLYRNPKLTAAYPLDWTRDGRRILVRMSTAGGPTRLVLISTADGSAQTLQIPQGATVGNAVLDASSDGLIYTTGKTQTGGTEIHRLSLSGADTTLIASTGSNDSVIGWAPDRRRLIFLSDRRGQQGIWAVAVSSRGVEGDPAELIPNAVNWEPIGMTHTGSLLYSLDAREVDVYTAELDLAQSRTVSGPTKVMDRNLGSWGYPSWSPDGRSLLFGSTREPLLMIVDRQTGTKRELKVNLQAVGRAQWMKNGTSIMALGETKSGTQGHYRIDAATGEAKLFRTSSELESGVEGVWSADGKVHFNRFTDFTRGLFRLNVETGERRVIYVPPAGADIATENLALSPDGRTLAFHARNGSAQSASLMLLSVEGEDPRTLLTIHQPESFGFGSFAWTPDSKKILAARTRGGANGTSEIWQAPVDGSRPVKVDFPAIKVAALRLNPDGRTIAFHCGKPRSEVWMIQNFM